MDRIKKSAIELYYEGRKEYSIIGLTGIAGSGCTYLSRVMSMPKEDLLKQVRTPEQILNSESFENHKLVVDNEELYAQGGNVNDEQLMRFIFKRKYEACYNLIQARYTPYRIIKYTHVLWLYVLLYLKHVSKGNWCKGYLLDQLSVILQDKYRPSINPDIDKEFIDASGFKEGKRAKEISELLEAFTGWSQLVDDIGTLSDVYLAEDLRSSHISYEDKLKLSEYFFNSQCLRDFFDFLVRFSIYINASASLKSGVILYPIFADG